MRLIKMPSEFAKRLGPYLVFLVLGIGIYWGPIHNPRMTSFDDGYLITPVRHLKSLEKYFQLRRQSVVLDLQPVRDLSYYLEGRFEDVFHVQNSQLVNLLLWIGSISVLFQILNFIGRNRWINLMLASIILVHPIAVNSVAWPSARKHLLSAFFVMLATKSSLGAVRGSWRKRSIWLYFFLSCLSQPINCLWPIWLGIRARTKPKLKAVFLISAGISFFTVVFNFYYYNLGNYKILNGLGKIGFQSRVNSGISLRLLALGRDCFQFLIPIHSSVGPYTEQSPSNTFGLILLGVVVIIIYLNRAKSLLNLWLVLFACPIFMMVAPLTEHLGWDTYLLTPLLMVGPWLSQAYMNSSHNVIKSFSGRARLFTLCFANYFWILCAFTLILFASLSHDTASHWTDDLDMWQFSRETEPSELNLSALANYHIDHTKNYLLAKKYLLELLELNPDSPRLGYPLGQLIFEGARSNEEAGAMLKKFKINNIWYFYYQALQESSEGHYFKAEKKLRDILNINQGLFLFNIYPKIPEFLASWMYTCQRAQKSDCNEFLNKIIRSIPTESWDQSRYENKLKWMLK
jgi:hypothetical protein